MPPPAPATTRVLPARRDLWASQAPLVLALLLVLLVLLAAVSIWQERVRQRERAVASTENVARLLEAQVASARRGAAPMWRPHCARCWPPTRWPAGTRRQWATTMRASTPASRCRASRCCWRPWSPRRKTRSSARPLTAWPPAGTRAPSRSSASPLPRCWAAACRWTGCCMPSRTHHRSCWRCPTATAQSATHGRPGLAWQPEAAAHSPDAAAPPAGTDNRRDATLAPPRAHPGAPP